MDILIQFVKENFVLILLFIGVFVLIRIIAKKIVPLVGAVFVVGLLIYAFTGDDTFFNKTVDTSTQAVNIIKDEVETAEFSRTSPTTFVVKTRNFEVTGNEETKLATVAIGEKEIEMPLANLYKLLSEDIQAQINF